MTELILKKENGSIVYFEVKGHSGYAQEGADIVCASVSSVVWCVINGLENVLHLKPVYSESSAHITCRIPCPDSKSREKADVLLSSMELFMAQLQMQYPDFITKTEV